MLMKKKKFLEYYQFLGGQDSQNKEKFFIRVLCSYMFLYNIFKMEGHFIGMMSEQSF